MSQRPVNNQTVFECKVMIIINPTISVLIDRSYFQYELDSLCGFLKLSRLYYQNTKDTSFMNNNCMCALLTFLSLWH